MNISLHLINFKQHYSLHYTYQLGLSWCTVTYSDWRRASFSAASGPFHRL